MSWIRLATQRPTDLCCSVYLSVCQCFAVRSLGWLEVEEEDLSPGRSSLAVSNVIQQLSHCSSPDQRDRPGASGEVRERPQISSERSEIKLVLFGIMSPRASAGSRDDAGSEERHSDLVGPFGPHAAALPATHKHPCVGCGLQQRQVSSPT